MALEPKATGSNPNILQSVGIYYTNVSIGEELTSILWVLSSKIPEKGLIGLAQVGYLSVNQSAEIKAMGA